MPDKDTNPVPDPAEWPIDGTLDLHQFQPGEVGDLVPEYLAECRKLAGVPLGVSTTQQPVSSSLTPAKPSYSRSFMARHPYRRQGRPCGRS